MAGEIRWDWCQQPNLKPDQSFTLCPPAFVHNCGYLADVVWRGPPEKYADMARTFRRLGRAYEIAALTKRTDDL
jgi:hypothetical protein